MFNLLKAVWISLGSNTDVWWLSKKIYIFVQKVSKVFCMNLIGQKNIAVSDMHPHEFEILIEALSTCLSKCLSVPYAKGNQIE